MSKFSTNFRTFFLSTIVTRLIKAPKVELTTRELKPSKEVWVPTRHGQVRCLITWPAKDAPLNQTANPPVFINLHGGAYLIGAPEQDDHFIRGIAGEVGSVVVNVDYSRGPKHRYPTAQEEVYDVLRWIADSGAEHGWDSTRISIGGGSAGAHLALGVIELARVAKSPKIRSASLIVPIVDITPAPESFVSSYKKAMVSPGLVESMLAGYFSDEARRSEFMASPLLGTKEQISALPPLLVVSAEFDTLKTHIEKFVELAKSAGVDVTYKEFLGFDHDFPVRANSGDVQKELSSLINAHLSKTLS